MATFLRTECICVPYAIVFVKITAVHAHKRDIASIRHVDRIAFIKITIITTVFFMYM